MPKEDYKMKFDIGTIKHLGLQMYSTLPPVIGELVSNAWDADSECVYVNIPIGMLTDDSVITVTDDGLGMSDEMIRDAYLVVGRDRRKVEGDKPTPKHGRKLQGRKGIGKFSGFGIAHEIEIETVREGETSRFKMNYADLEKNADQREILMPPLEPTGTVKKGTAVTLRDITKFRKKSIDVKSIRRRLARRFSVIGEDSKFQILVNGARIEPDERDLKRLLEKDGNGELYLWEYDDSEIASGTGWRVSGWIGALKRTQELEDGVQRGIAVMARGKLVQEPFVFEATVGQQFALSYLIGELHAEFVDEAEDTIGTTRNSLVWDTEANAAFKEWGQKQVNKVAREWAERRNRDNERKLNANPLYRRFVQEAEDIDNKRAVKVADKLIKDVIKRDVIGGDEAQEQVVQLCLDFLEFDAFWELAQDLTDTPVEETARVLQLFREWEVVEAKEMMKVTGGRITTIKKLQKLINEDTLEVPTLHNFLKEFPWVLDPRWNLVADEKTYSDLLKDRFGDEDLPEDERRIDFLCVKESNNLIVVEIKRPRLKASMKELEQIEDYIIFMRDHVQKTTDPELRGREVLGYLLCGDTVDTYRVRGKRENLERSRIYIRRYGDLLRMVEANHREFLDRYGELRKAKTEQGQLG